MDNGWIDVILIVAWLFKALTGFIVNGCEAKAQDIAQHSVTVEVD